MIVGRPLQLRPFAVQRGARLAVKESIAPSLVLEQVTNGDACGSCFFWGYVHMADGCIGRHRGPRVGGVCRHYYARSKG